MITTQIAKPVVNTSQRRILVEWEPRTTMPVSIAIRRQKIDGRCPGSFQPSYGLIRLSLLTSAVENRVTVTTTCRPL
jgi:hypothetical protein